MNEIHNADVCAVIVGSFRRHLREIVTVKHLLQERGIAVLSPSGNYALNPDEEFILLDSDPVSHPRLLQDSVFAKIRKSSFIVVANVDGYLGKAAILEMGYSIAQGIAIYTLELVDDPNLKSYCKLLADLITEMEHADQARLAKSEHLI